MDLRDVKLETEELHLADDAEDYVVVVRLNRHLYKKVGNSPYKELDRRIELAKFTVSVSRKPSGRQKRERPIEKIKDEAKRAVLKLCQHIVKELKPSDVP